MIKTRWAKLSCLNCSTVQDIKMLKSCYYWNKIEQ
jgi:hypothetical protein